MFVEVRDRTLARSLFARTVNRVELETHSYCNRRCTYCPNVVGDRLGPNVFMPSDVWEKIIGGLEEIGYAHNIVLNYYNEPLADRSILERIREIRRRVPKARIMIFSNGDYLDQDYLDELADAGLDYLHISVHLKRGDQYTDIYVVNRINEISVRIGIASPITSLKSKEYAIARTPHPRMEIEIRGINFHKHGTDRGGLIDDITTAQRRRDPCSFPFQHFVVGYNGQISPCCHIRSDRPEHAALTYGNLRDFGSIFEAFTSEPAAAWRRELIGDQEKRSPCDTCAAGKLRPDEAAICADAYRLHVLHTEPAARAG
jgi:MoaA/NifB/PqqE/SkfB family radical SAM enzyme